MRHRMLVTDLDNTLYDWVTYFATAFGAMTKTIHEITGISEATLFGEFKKIYQHYGNSEQPFAALELPSVRQHFGTSDRSQLKEYLNPAFHVFNRMRKQHLHLYRTVDDTMRELHETGCILIAHTEAMLLNSYWRLSFFDLERYLTRLYTLEGKWQPHPAPDQLRMKDLPAKLARIVPLQERKPNPIFF